MEGKAVVFACSVVELNICWIPRQFKRYQTHSFIGQCMNRMWKIGSHTHAKGTVTVKIDWNNGGTSEFLWIVRIAYYQNGERIQEQDVDKYS